MTTHSLWDLVSNSMAHWVRWLLGERPQPLVAALYDVGLVSTTVHMSLGEILRYSLPDIYAADKSVCAYGAPALPYSDACIFLTSASSGADGGQSLHPASLQQYTTLSRAEVMQTNRFADEFDVRAVVSELPVIGREFCERVLLQPGHRVQQRHGYLQLPPCALGRMCVSLLRDNYYVGFPHGLPGPLPAFITPAEYEAVRNGLSPRSLEGNYCLLCIMHAYTAAAWRHAITRMPPRHIAAPFRAGPADDPDNAFDPALMLGHMSPSLCTNMPVPVLPSSVLCANEDATGLRFTPVYVARCVQAARAAREMRHFNGGTPEQVSAMVEAAAVRSVHFFEWGPSALPTSSSSYTAYQLEDRVGYITNAGEPPRNGGVACRLRWNRPSPANQNEYIAIGAALAGFPDELLARFPYGTAAYKAAYATLAVAIAPYMQLAELLVKVAPSNGIYKDATTCVRMHIPALATAHPHFFARLVAGALSGVLLGCDPCSIDWRWHAALADECIRNPAQLGLCRGVVIFALRAYLVRMVQAVRPLANVLDHDLLLTTVRNDMRRMLRWVPRGGSVVYIERQFGELLRTCGVQHFVRTYAGDCPQTLCDIFGDMCVSNDDDDHEHEPRSPIAPAIIEAVRELCKFRRPGVALTSTAIAGYFASATVRGLSCAAQLFYRGATQAEIQRELATLAVGEVDLVTRCLHTIRAERRAFVVPLPGFIDAQRRALAERYGLSPATAHPRIYERLATGYYCCACGSFLMSTSQPWTDSAKTGARGKTKKAAQMQDDGADALQPWHSQSRMPAPQCLATGAQHMYVNAEYTYRTQRGEAPENIPTNERYVCAHCFAGRVPVQGTGTRRRVAHDLAGTTFGDVQSVSLLGAMLVLDGRAWIVCPGCASFTEYTIGHMLRAGTPWHWVTCGNCETTRAYYANRGLSCIGRNCGHTPHSGAMRGRIIHDAHERAWICARCDAPWLVKLTSTRGVTIEELRDILEQRGSVHYHMRHAALKRVTNRTLAPVATRARPAPTRAQRSQQRRLRKLRGVQPRQARRTANALAGATLP